MLIIKNAINKLKRISAITVVFLLSIFIISYAASEQFDIKGKIVNLEIEPSNDPQNPNLWPCLIADNKQNILAAGSPDILKELYDLSGKEVTLNVKKLPMQNFSGKEYGCYEVAEIEKLRGQEYLSPRKAIKEFKQALQERNIISESGTQTIEGAIRSIWYDKNENKIIDANDKLFITSISTGTQNNRYLLYPSKVVIRKYRFGIRYHTLILPDPAPKIFEPAALGKLQYDKEKNVYFLEVDRLHRKDADIFTAPLEEEKVLVINTSGNILKSLIGKFVLLTGSEYNNVLWHGDKKEDIIYRDGEYIIALSGRISITKISLQHPWKSALVLFTDKEGQQYELRKGGYVSFWEKFKDKEIIVTGTLRRINFYGFKPICVIEAFEIQ